MNRRLLFSLLISTCSISLFGQPANTDRTSLGSWSVHFWSAPYVQIYSMKPNEVVEMKWRDQTGPGFALGLGGSYRINSRLSIKADMVGSVQTVDENWVAKHLEHLDPSHDWSLQADNWKMYGFYYGPSLHLYKSEHQKFKPEAYVLPGLIYVLSPYKLYQAKGNTETLRIEFLEWGSTTLSVSGGLLIPWQIKDKLELAIHLNFMACYPYFDRLPERNKNGIVERFFSEQIGVNYPGILIRYSP